jgi:hypothetical protein
MRAAIERRIAEIELQVAALRPPAPHDELLAWAHWTTDEELEFLEGVAKRGVCGVEPSADEQLRWIEIEAGATRRMLAGEPNCTERNRWRDAAVSRWPI